MPQTVLNPNSLLLPTGNNSARPGSPVAGMTRYNTASSTIEYYNGSAWVGLGLQDGSSESTAAPSAAYIQTVTGTTTSGTYWIKNSSMSVAVQVYCDMSYDDGGYMLLAYGYVGSTGDSSANFNIPNLNHDSTQYSYTPTNRATNHGLVASPNSQKSALLIAKASTTFLMAAGANPSTGGINSYTYVYKFPIPNASALTFNNFGPGYNGSMTVSTVTVTGLKGETGTYTRYTSTQSLGATWGDSYPSGYGAIPNTTPIPTGEWNSGPFFPSIQAGSRSSGNNGNQNVVPINSSPDIGVNGFTTGSRSYTYRGWYSATGTDYTGQTSIWVK
jgi:hypothetical protein